MTQRHSKIPYRVTHMNQRALCLSLLFILFVVSTPLFACATGGEAKDRSVSADPPHLVHDFPSKTEAGLVNVVVEIPAGTNAKWEVAKDSGQLEWEQRDGRPRIVDYLAYPGNYGMVPRTLLPRELGGDGDPLDVMILGPALERGSVVAVRLIGVLELLDGGEQDDKLIAVLPGAPLGEVTSLAELDRRYAGIGQIIELWFANYKGPGEMQAKGFRDPARAKEILDAAISAYAYDRN